MKGWLDNFGKADNANDSNVSLPEGFVGLGYNTKGRNYSPAWGGQFEQGGTVPIAQNGVSEYMKKKIQEKKDESIAAQYSLPEVVVSAPYLTKYNDPNKPTGFPQYEAKSDDIAEFYKSWVSSPEYERRMKDTGYYETPMYNSSRQSSITLPKGRSTIYLSPSEFLEDVRRERMGLLESTQDPGFIEYDPKYASEYRWSGINLNPKDITTPERKQSVLAHEIAHAIDTTTPYENELISGTMFPTDAFNKQFYSQYSETHPVTGEPILSSEGWKKREKAAYVKNDPQEFKSDLNALRYLMFDKGIYDIRKGKEFTKKDLEKAKEKLKDNESLQRSLDAAGETGFIKLMNIIAKGDEEVAPIAMNGASMPGSVGFTYARTAGAAPSNGPYAKKTKASAQNGIIADKIAGLELKMSPEYQRLKYLQSLPQLRQAPGRGEELVREGLATADIATDLMQIGNFIPHPMAQGVGKAGNILGSGVDLAQALMSARQGDYLDAAINVGSVGLAGGLAANTFRRNSKYLQPGQPLYALSPQAFGSLSRTNYIEPFRKVGKMTDKNLLANRALLGLIGAETVYDAIPQKEYGGEIPSAQSGIMTPMLLGRKILSYLYPSEEAAPTVSAAPVEYKKGLTDELLKRQAYKESTFNPSAVSPAGYKGLTQIGEQVLTDYSKKKGGKKLDPFNPKDAVELQKFAMDDLYNASFINKPNQPDSVRIAKTLAAYNWGRGNLFNYLNEQKQKGVDIYGSYDWLNDLPKETSDYVNKILLQEDQSFNKNYKRDSTNPKYKDVTSLYDKKKFGGKVTTAQNGQEMKFYQNGLDWKPKSMQDGDNIERVSINDPRYPELYKNRQVGAYYDGAYSLPDLDEVTITAPRSYTMDSLRDFTTAALYGAPATAMKLSMVPQAAMTEGIEALRGKPYDFSNAGPNLGYFGSNQRDLSQTMGYENPQGFLQKATNFGLSMVDPLNLVGANVIAKTIPTQAIKSSVINTKNNLSRAIKGTGSFIDQVKGEILQGEANRKSIKIGNEWLQNWIDNPATRQKIDADIDRAIALKGPDATIDDLNYLELVRNQSKDFVPNSKEYSLYNQLNDNLDQYLRLSNTKLKPIHGKNMGISLMHSVDPQTRELIAKGLVPADEKYGSFISRNTSIPQVERQYTAIHEGTHDWLPEEVVKKLGMRNIALKNINPEAKQYLLDIEAGLKDQLTDEQKYLGYLADPTEQHARIMELRANLGLKPEDVVDEDLAKEIIKKIENRETPVDRRFLKVIDSNPLKLAERFNRFWAVPAVGAVVGSQAVDQQKNGGITKDNRGYWNPDNWGKPVEIDSNIITMEGVNQPLLGISDTGDTKLMQPGKNYKFKGKKVTEFPVAELGINQLDAQPMKKLNQLLNFTNNPDKDNWLDKYN